MSYVCSQNNFFYGVVGGNVLKYLGGNREKKFYINLCDVSLKKKLEVKFTDAS